MTYLELIKEANRKIDKGEITSGEYDEMIKPLMQEIQSNSDEDCISRNHLLSEIAELKKSPWFNDDTNGAKAIRKDAVEVIEDLCIKKEPSIQPKAKWIPVTERLPKDNEYVLMTVRRTDERYNHFPFITVGYISWNQSRWWCSHDGDCKESNIEVVAWMSLSKLYKEKEK